MLGSGGPGLTDLLVNQPELVVKAEIPENEQHYDYDANKVENPIHGFALLSGHPVLPLVPIERELRDRTVFARTFPCSGRKGECRRLKAFKTCQHSKAVAAELETNEILLVGQFVLQNGARRPGSGVDRGPVERQGLYLPETAI